MALPIRLIVGPDNLMEISLEAQSIDIVVDRNASAFPTPDNIVGRVAIDTNIPEIDIEIDGIFQDDTGATFDTTTQSAHYSGGDVAFNFASILPTNQHSLTDNYQWKKNFNPDSEYMVVKFETAHYQTDDITGLVNISPLPDVGDPLQTNLVVDLAASLGVGTVVSAGPRSTIDHPSAGTYAVGSTSIVVDNASPFEQKGRIHLADGTFVGTITSIDSPSKTLYLTGGTKASLGDGVELFNYRWTVFSSNGQIIGSVVDLNLFASSAGIVTKIGLDGFSEMVYSTVDYYLTGYSQPPLEALLHNKKFVLYPNYWRIDGITTSRSTPLGVNFVFSNDMAHADYQNQKIGNTQVTGTYPTISNLGQHSESIDADGKRIAGTGGFDVYVKLPIGGITTHAVNGNPASTLALIVKKALELTADAVSNQNGSITSTGGQSLADAFSVLVSGPTLKVKQKDGPIDSSQFLSVTLDPCRQYQGNYPIPISDAGIIDEATIQYFAEPYVLSSVSINSKSAGDKVQDLLGLVSNAKKDTDLIRGIQIPYDSLIQSDAVTPTARNFFLTFGEQTDGGKGSAGNTISASHKMIPSLLPADLGGKPEVDNDDAWYDKLGIGDAVDTVSAIAGFVGNLVGDTFVTLATEPHGNDGGIRIIPEKLHVRYDAGNNYYAFKLKLKASDFVIGV